MNIRIWRNLLLIILFSVFLAFTDNPWKFPKLETEIPVITNFWNWMQDSEISLGLDLQGGTQLDYEIDLRDANARNHDDDASNDVDIDALLSGVKDVIERRVNSMGVSEPNIYLSQAGDERHIVVELPGVEDIDEAKDRVGKVVQLEFKTQKPQATDADREAIREQADAFYERVKAEESIDDLEDYVDDIVEPNQIEYRIQENAFLDELPEEFRDIVPEMETGVFYDRALLSKESEYVFQDGQVYQPEGINIFRLKEKSSDLRKRPVNAEDFLGVMKELGQSKSDKYLRKKEFDSDDLARAITSLEVGEITGVVKTDEGFFIAKMDDIIKADTSADAVPQIHTAHILLKTQAEVPLKPIKALKEISDSLGDEEKAKIEEENKAIEKENTESKKINTEISEQNAGLEEKNNEVKTRAEKILAELKEDPSRFSELAKKYSEDSSADKGGDLGYAVPSSYVQAYQDAVKTLEKGSFTQELVQSKFGYHIIKLIDTKQASETLYRVSMIRICYDGATGCEEAPPQVEAQTKADDILKRVREESTYTVERVWFNTLPSPWEDTELDGKYFKHAFVTYDRTGSRVPYVAVSFDDKGAELFSDLTQANVGKPMAIFVGGEFISAPTIQERITGGNARITLGQSNIQLALKEANELASSLNAGSIPAPLKKPSELNIGATLGKEALNKSLQAGLLGLVLVALFMIFYYRLMGVLAATSLVVYGLFLTFIIQSDISPLISVILSFVLWLAFSLRILRSKIDSLAKTIFLAFSVIGVLFVFFILSTPIVLTLAGVAGLILSIGMAVDANILIFERIKEEFAQGKSFLSSVSDGFDRAWSSILDSNVSSLITCLILFHFGTGVIRGFAFNLAAGILISMFTAITVTKVFLLLFNGTKMEKIKWLWKRK